MINMLSVLETMPHLTITQIVLRPHERTVEDLEIIYEELLHIKALSHLSTMVKRELASVLVFESHAKAGTVCVYILLYFDYNTEAIRVKYFITATLVLSLFSNQPQDI